MNRDEVSIAVGIAHADWQPERRVWVLRQLKALLTAQGNPKPGLCAVKVFKDTVRQGYAWPNFRTALRWAYSRPEATHVLVLFDDFIPVPNFVDGLVSIVATKPADLLGLFTARDVADRCRSAGKHWFTSKNYTWGGTHVYPVEMAVDLDRWVARSFPSNDQLSEDDYTALYAMEHGRRIWTAQPSIVEHAGAPISTIGNANRNRVARWLCDDAADVDWTAGADEPIAIGHAWSGEAKTRALYLGGR